MTEDGKAVWAVVRQKTPSKRGSGASRGRTGETDARPAYVWRNMMFRNLGPDLASDLIRQATWITRKVWSVKYGETPTEPLRTEVDPRKVKSRNPGYCYLMAGWKRGGKTRDGKLIFYAP